MLITEVKTQIIIQCNKEYFKKLLTQSFND